MYLSAQLGSVNALIQQTNVALEYVKVNSMMIFKLYFVLSN
jgi:hypothetical protein